MSLRYNTGHTITTKGQNYERYVSDYHMYTTQYIQHIGIDYTHVLTRQI